ncbi:MAG: hypothetical protein QOG23_864, partial [Blastocatellia bacterium]|nr:hypothetical protein [Blastocatellia bacterium]
ITLKNAIQVLEAGADAVAVIAELVADSTRIAENLNKMLTLTSARPTVQGWVE